MPSGPGPGRHDWRRRSPRPRPPRRAAHRPGVMMPLITMGILVARTSSRSWATVLGSTAVSFGGIHPAAAGRIDVDGDHEGLGSLRQPDDADEVFVRPRFDAGDHLAGVAAGHLIAGFGDVPGIRLDVAHRTHGAGVHATADDRFEVIGLRTCSVSVGKFTARPPMRRRHRREGQLLAEDDGRAVGFLVAAERARLEFYALQAGEIVLK